MKIQSTAEISLETLNDFIADNNLYEITIQDAKNYPRGKTYDIFALLSIKRKMLEFLQGCPQYDPHNPNTEKEIFAYIYTKLALTVEYDDLAKEVNHATPTFKKFYAADYLDQASGLDSAMISERALCSGYAETLRNLLAEKGIEAKYISGTSTPVANSPEIRSHAWNQVKLDGEWFNCDVTHDRNFIKDGLIAPNFLKSNAHFKNYTSYSLYDRSRIEPAKRTISNNEQDALIGRYYDRILKEITPSTTEKNHPGFFKSILKKLHIIKSTEPEK